MKKNLLFAFFVGIAIVAVAATNPRKPRPNAMAVKPAMTAMSATAPVNTPQAIGTTEADYASITDWVSRGQVKYSDCITAQAWSSTIYYATYDVDLEESESNPGLYRVKNPVLNNPTLYDGDADTSQDFYMIVDCTDPDNVVIPECNYGLIDYTTGSHVYMKSYSAGSVADYKVTFSDWGLVFKIGESGSYAVASGAGCTFSLSLPGAKDYTMTLSVSALCNAGNTAEFTLTPGTDITTMKYAFGPDATLAKARTSELTLEGGEQSLEITEEGVNVLAVVGYDADGNEQATATAKFYRYDENADQWTTLGTTSMTEDFVEAFYASSGYGYGPNTFDVTVQENVSTPGFYRIVNPYENNNNSSVTGGQYHADDHNHYIFIHAEDPEAVTVDESPIGFNFYAMGDMTVRSYGSTHGSMSKGIVTMPAGTLYLTMGDYAVLNANDFVLIIPKEHTVTVKSIDEEYGTVAITDPRTEGTSLTTKEPSVTVVATPASGFAFLNWTDGEGNVLSAESAYTYVGTDDIELTASFGGKVSYTVETGGSAKVTSGGTAIASDAVLAIGSEVTVTVTPDSDRECEVTLNGNPVTLTDNACTFTVEANVEIKVSFTYKVRYVNFTIAGNGKMEVWTGIGGDEQQGTPAGTQLNSGDQIPGGTTELYVWFIPNEGESLESVTVKNGEDETALSAEDDYYIPLDAETAQESERLAKAYLYPLTDGINGDIVISPVFSELFQGIEEIGIDPADGPVKYFNLQGIRVADDNLVPGFYIVRQGSKTAKILISK